MATMNISLPDAMKAWVEAKVEEGRFANASEVVRAMIRRELDREEKIANMQRLVDEAYASGISSATMEDIKARALAEYEERKGKAA